MDEVERDIENYRGRGWRYLPKLQAEADNANRGLNNSRYPAKTEFNNYFIIHKELFIFYSSYELFFGIILFYSLCENKKPDSLSLQTIIRKRDVIITEYQELFADVTS